MKKSNKKEIYESLKESGGDKTAYFFNTDIDAGIADGSVSIEILKGEKYRLLYNCKEAAESLRAERAVLTAKIFDIEAAKIKAVNFINSKIDLLEFL